MNYRSVGDLSAVLVRGLAQLPPGAQLVAGIPRSGLLAASLLALYLDLPLADIDGLLSGRVLAAGNRGTRGGTLPAVPPPGATVLVVDDSVMTGSEMRRQKARLSELAKTYDLRYVGVFVAPDALGEVDVALEEVAAPRIFEWNLMHSLVVESACVDLDGVLCEDPSEAQNDDGPAYQEFLETARPRFLPSRPIGWIVTGRLEKYRRLTEEWLARHGVRYGSLKMVDLPDKATRDRLHDHAVFKGRVLRKLDADLFIESSEFQAPTIASVAGKPVWCVESRHLYDPSWPGTMKKTVLHPGLSLQRLVRRARCSLAYRLGWPTNE